MNFRLRSLFLFILLVGVCLWTMQHAGVSFGYHPAGSLVIDGRGNERRRLFVWFSFRWDDAEQVDWEWPQT